jgi:hypothetical protein
MDVLEISDSRFLMRARSSFFAAFNAAGVAMAPTFSISLSKVLCSADVPATGQIWIIAASISYEVN